MADHTSSFRPNTTQVPNAILDLIMADLSEAEFKVLMYIVRRTHGFQKDSDNISLSQLVEGIKRHDGSVLDRGTGMSRPAVVRGIKGLEARHLIAVTRNPGAPGRGHDTSHYSLILDPGNAALPGGAETSNATLPGVGTSRGAEVVTSRYPQNLDQNKEPKETDEQFARHHSNSRSVPKALAAQLVARHTRDGKLDRDRFMAALPKG